MKVILESIKIELTPDEAAQLLYVLEMCGKQDSWVVELIGLLQGAIK